MEQTTILEWPLPMPNIDPTKTTTVRKKTASTLRAGLVQSVRAFRDSVLRGRTISGAQTPSPFDLPPATQIGNLAERAFASEFSGGRRFRINNLILTAYKRGLTNAHAQVKQTDIINDLDRTLLKQTQFVQSVLASQQGNAELRNLMSRTQEAIARVQADFRSEASRAAAQAVTQGMTDRQFLRSMSEPIAKLSKRMELIAQTEIIRAHAEGQVTGFQALGETEIGIEAEWVTVGDARVCPQCLAMEGMRFPIAEARGLIPLHPNCVLGNSVVKFQDAFALTRATYFGSIFTITLKSGNRISVTENHILPTQSGWVRAADLNNSHQLLRTSLFDGNSVDCPDNEERHPQISDVFESAFEMVPESQRIVSRATSEDFHNDGRFCNPEVDIVVADGHLWDKSNIGGVDNIEKFQLSGGRLFKAPGIMNSNSASLHLLHRHSSSPYCGLGGLGVPTVLRCGTCGHHLTVSLDDPTGLDATIQESGIDARSRDPQSFGDLIDGLPGSVAFDDVVDVDIQPVLDRGVAVYDVWSHSSVYQLNGILSSNCRCSWVVIPKDK